jgi:hypothetical protein
MLYHLKKELQTAIPPAPAASKPRKKVTGVFLAKAKLSSGQRAKLAVAHRMGWLDLDELTVPQLAELFGCSPAEIYRELKAVGAYKPHNPSNIMTNAWDRASAQEREAFINNVGCAEVWDSLSAVVS